MLKQYRRYMITEDHSGYLVIEVDKEIELTREIVRDLYDLIRNSGKGYVPYNWYNKFEPPRKKVLLYLK